MRSSDAGEMTRDEFERVLRLATTGEISTDTGAGKRLSEALWEVSVDPSQKTIEEARAAFEVNDTSAPWWEQ